LSATLAALAALVACGGDSSGVRGVPPSDVSQVPLSVERVFAGLPAFAQPVAMLQAPGDATRWFVVEQAGRVRVFANDPAVAASEEFVDIAPLVAFRGEAGLLGMAFHPQFPVDPRAYLFYSHDDATLGLVSRISEFSTEDGGLTLEPDSERILLTIDKDEDNHNGGGIAFGPDGFLYAGVGDGGGANDQHGTIGNAQSTSTLLGKILRIDVSGDPGSVVPEIFALGLRNPWRWSFDRSTGQLWVGDVGQGALEEIDRVVQGGNYGWRCFEGTLDTGLACGSPAQVSPPVAQYGRSVGTSITGGYVYRGSALPALAGRYVFGDFGSGRIFNIDAAAQPTLTLGTGFSSGLSISSFGEGIDGEIYVVHYGGELYRIAH
jgi:glucose/arabinose dehydrogenase